MTRCRPRRCGDACTSGYRRHGEPVAVPEPVAMTTCIRCGVSTRHLIEAIDDRALCPGCKERVCAGCGSDAADVMCRSVGKIGNPVLCTRCCSAHPAREWMRTPGWYVFSQLQGNGLEPEQRG